VFERFTDRARRVVVLAQEEARMLNHNYIGTEHILLGLIHEGDGVAMRALESLGISLEPLRRQVDAFIGQVEEEIGQDQAVRTTHLRFTPPGRKVLELALREALQLGHNYIGTEHILLALIREGEGVAAHVLQKLGADLNRVRQTVILLLSGYTAGKGEQIASRQEVRAALDPPSPFDEREKIVLSLLLQGTTTSGIANLLGVSKEKVDEIIQAVIDRLRGILGPGHN
jgi:ATP-dependent Clp protease ATP-binding subunit ClpC